jgi:hypothetical protein
MDYIHRHHWCFSFGFTSFSFIPHIPYAFQVNVQQVLHILLFWLTFDPSNIATWHFFCYSLLGVCPFLHGVVRKTIKRFVFACANTWVVIGKHHMRGDITWGTHMWC